MGKTDRRESVRIGPVYLDDVTMSETIAMVDSLVLGGGRFQICTPNFDHVLLAEKDEEFCKVLTSATLRVPDGMGVVYASHFLGTPMRGLVGGRLLINPLCALAEKRRWRVVLVGGGEPHVAAQAATNLRKKFPELDVVGIYPGQIDSWDRIPQLEAHLPCDILLVGLGTPKQEKWIYRHLSDLKVGLAIGIGAGIDFTAGQLASPPQWATNLGVEWVFRVAQDPIRLHRRYIVGIPRFLLLIIRQRIRG